MKARRWSSQEALNRPSSRQVFLCPSSRPNRNVVERTFLIISQHSKISSFHNNKIIEESLSPAILFPVFKPAEANYSECYKKVKFSLGKN